MGVESQSILKPSRLIAKPKPIPSSSLDILKTPLDANLQAIIEKDSDIIMNNDTSIEVIVDMNHTNVCKTGNEPLKEHSSAKIKKDLGIKKSVVSSRRTSTVVKTLTSSKLGELYERLIDKKLQLLDCLNKEHIQRMKLLELEEQIKLAELNGILSAKPIQRTPQTFDVNEFIGESDNVTL